MFGRFDNYRQIILHVIQIKQVKISLGLLIFFGLAMLSVTKFFPNYRWSICLFWTSIIANTFIPLTLHEPILIYYGKFYSPQLIALIATIAVIFIELINYLILIPLLGIGKVKIIREKRFFQYAEYCFGKCSFLSILVSCFLPIPFFPFRTLSVTTSYSIKRYILSIFIGRLPRYFLIAKLGEVFSPPAWACIIAIIIFPAFILAKKLNERKMLKNESV